MKVKLKRCPFCNSHELSLQLNIAVYWIKCADCCATGPESIRPETAVRLWNGEETRAGYTSLVTLRKGSNRNDLKTIELD